MTASALAIVGGGLVLALLWVGLALWREPMRLVRAEFTRQRLAAGLSRGTVVAAGHRWVYAHGAAAHTSAKAPILVMLHGYTGSKENWYPLVRALAGRYRLLIPDLPGWGESERRPEARYGFPEQASHVAAFLRAVVPDQPVVLLGHSMGGGIAALVAARYPQLVAKLGLLNAAGVRFADNRFGLDVLAGHNPFAVTDAASLQRYLDAVFHRTDAKPWIPWPASVAVIAQRRADAAFEQAVLACIGRSDEALLPGDEAVNIHLPTLLLWGRQDAVIDVSAMAIYASRIPQAQQCLLDDCGHMSLMEWPSEVAAAVAALVAAPAR